jgi:hypothetical protein
MTTVSSTPPTTTRSTGRAWFWAGLGACLLGLALLAVHISQKWLFMPWYTPALATLGALFVLVAVARRRSIVRVAALLLLAAFAGLQWFFFASLMRLPAYEGPARPGQPFPAFHSSFADSRPFVNADLQDGTRRALVFFRGRW